MALNLSFDGKSIGNAWYNRFTVDIRQAISQKLMNGAHKAAAELLSQGRQNIAGSGKFGKRWTGGLFTQVDEHHDTIRAEITLGHRLWFAPIHEFGGIVRGKPLLWIPLSFAHDAQGVYARDYNKHEGGLFRVDRGGGKVPLLLSIRDKQPKYFAKEQVYIPARWGLRAISRNIMRNFQYYYTKGAD